MSLAAAIFDETKDLILSNFAFNHQRKRAEIDPFLKSFRLNDSSLCEVFTDGSSNVLIASFYLQNLEKSFIFVICLEPNTKNWVLNYSNDPNQWDKSFLEHLEKIHP